MGANISLSTIELQRAIEVTISQLTNEGNSSYVKGVR